MSGGEFWAVGFEKAARGLGLSSAGRSEDWNRSNEAGLFESEQSVFGEMLRLEPDQFLAGLRNE